MNDSTTPLVGIFADDLTGALDAAAPFAARGFRTLVSPTTDLPSGGNRAEVISINLGTRHSSSAEIKKRTHEAVASLARLGVRVLLNKIDSTLRGNPGVELLHALNTVSGDHAVLCSAYPQQGRIVSSGVLLVDGVPVADTDVGRDQLSPLITSNVEEILLSALNRAGVGGDVHVRGEDGGAAVSDYLPVIITANARSEADMSELAERLLAAESTALVAGSAGMAVALADSMNVGRLGRSQAEDPPGSRGRKILIVTASQRSIVQDQISILSGQIDLVQAELSFDEAFGGVTEDSIDQLIDVAQNDGIVVLSLERLDSETVARSGNLVELAATIVRNLGVAVRTVTDEVDIDTLIVIGGDTSGGVLEACGVSSLDLRGEFQPGTVSGIPVDGSIAGTLLVTRAGGFGDENSLLELVSLLEFGHNV